MPRSQFSVASHFTKSSENVKNTYDALLSAARKLGPVEQQAKKTSIEFSSAIDHALRILGIALADHGNLRSGIVNLVKIVSGQLDIRRTEILV